MLTLYDPIAQKLKRGARGLDYGSGPGPALAEMFKEDHYDIEIYDPYFFPDDSCLNQQYDFITCTETAEHFFNPNKEFDLINSLLNKGGWLGVMTSFLTTKEAFDSWYYRRDPTHVVFYAEETFGVIAKQRNWHCEIITKDVVLFNKN